MLRFKKNQKYVVFDYETNGLNLLGQGTKPCGVKPWQLSYIIAEGNDIIETRDRYIWWDNFEMDERVAKLNHFDFYSYKENAKSPQEVHSEFNQLVYDPEVILVGHNILGFDVYMHSVIQREVGLKIDYSYLSRLIDTLCMARAIKKDLKKNEQSDLLSWQYRLLSIRERGLKTKLSDCLDDYDIPHDKQLLHNSLYDVKMNFEVFKKQIWKIEI